MTYHNNEIIKLLQKEENKKEIKSVFNAIIDICFLDIYPYFYCFAVVFVFLILFNLAVLIYLVRVKITSFVKK